MELVDGMTLDVSVTARGILLRGILLHRPGRRPRRPVDQVIARINPAAYRRKRELSRDRPAGQQ